MREGFGRLGDARKGAEQEARGGVRGEADRDEGEGERVAGLVVHDPPRQELVAAQLFGQNLAKAARLRPAAAASTRAAVSGSSGAPGSGRPA